MKTKINDTYVIILSIVIIALFISINIYMENDNKWNEHVKWGEINIPPTEERASGLFEYEFNTIIGKELIVYDSGSGEISGNFSKMNNTLIFSDVSLTIIDINEEYLKALMVPSDIPVGKYCLFTVQTSLQEEYEHNVSCNDEYIAWDDVYNSEDILIFGVSFNQVGLNNITIQIGTEKNNFKLEWTVNVR